MVYILPMFVNSSTYLGKVSGCDVNKDIPSIQRDPSVITCREISRVWITTIMYIHVRYIFHEFVLRTIDDGWH